MTEETQTASGEEAPPLGVQREHEIFFRGVAHEKPGVPVAYEELEKRAREVMSPEAFGYVSGNAGAGDTAKANRRAFERWQFVPRFLRDVSKRDLSVEVLGRRHALPLFIAPVGVQGILHKEGELATARAAKKVGVPMILSTYASTPLERVAQELGESPRWFQLYWPGSRDICASFVERAEAAGYHALVVTLDSFHIGWREVDLQNGYNPFPHGDGLANFMSDPVFRSLLNVSEKVFETGAVRKCIPLLTNPALTWEDLKFLRERTRLPIVLKGILHANDARRAVDAGVSGIVVSNHGGRQVDGAIGALDALVRIVEAVGSQTDVLFDSGIRRGADVCKALALGARAVLIGRPWCYGLGIAGEAGVEAVLRNLLAEVDLTLGLAGGRAIKDLRELIERAAG